nr:sigma 54-interacting transcriptional regulator [Chitinasiproducens palmae]
MLALIARGKRFIDRGLPILILGETGTGKEFLARALHAYSERRRGAMVALNCASIPENLIESELFGYCRGAFSGALSQGMRGKVVQADGGTLFLDEIGDMPFAQQTRLLRVLSEGEVLPLGASRPTPVDVQLICATHQDLFTKVEDGSFREDLYYRIAVGVLRLPSLRERSDRGALIARMIDDEWPGASLDVLTPAAHAELLAHAWPGNLRQLRAAIRYACAVASEDCIGIEDLPVELMRARAVVRHSEPAAVSRSDSTFAMHSPAGSPRTDERGQILHALAASRWNISAAARTLGMCRASLYRRLKTLAIPHVRDVGSELLGGGEDWLAATPALGERGALAAVH